LLKAFVMVWLRPIACLPDLARLSAPLAALIIAAGCASSSGSEATRVETRSVLAADGLPARVHAAADLRHLPDDPSQPLSPHLGSATASRFARGVEEATSLDADAIIAAAITAHEMRKP
jgi:hypothetical protein